jgi:pyrimidine-nucleoside phosphorylase/thymidine phosphorylase
MNTPDIIAKKRDGGELTGDEIAQIVDGLLGGRVADYQMAALLMAIYLRGMTTAETLALTRRMLYSGTVLDPPGGGRLAVDKHSTGGVGDKTSLIVAPVVAAAGVCVPMISGRALGHSGGTLDKLESIPGFRTDLSLAEFRSALDRIGVAMIGQTDEIAPADKVIYALRDVTATVGARPLMTASIMSKKLAEGIDGLVLDVKMGSGAFLKSEAEVDGLARLMVDIALGMGKRSVALITDMNQPLGRAVGNSIEVIESLETLKGNGPPDLVTLCRELSAEMVVLGRAAADLEKGRELYDELIGSGRALEKLREIIQGQGGDPRVCDDYGRLPRGSEEAVIRANRSGYVAAIDTEAIGRASMQLGAGRSRLEDAIDPAVGIRVSAKPGDEIGAGMPLAVLYYNDASKLDQASRLVERAYTLTDDAVRPPDLVKSRIA